MKPARVFSTFSTWTADIYTNNSSVSNPFAQRCRELINLSRGRILTRKNENLLNVLDKLADQLLICSVSRDEQGHLIQLTVFNTIIIAGHIKRKATLAQDNHVVGRVQSINTYSVVSVG